MSMIVNHACTLHKRITNRRADKSKTQCFELFGHHLARVGFRGHLGCGLKAVLHRSMIHMLPKQVGKCASALRLLIIYKRLSIAYQCGQLEAVANEARVLQPQLHLGRAFLNQLRGRESKEGCVHMGALFEDSDPAESGLHTLELQQSKQRLAIAHGHPPLLIVVGDVQVIARAPMAALRILGSCFRFGRHGLSPFWSLFGVSGGARVDFDGCEGFL